MLTASIKSAQLSDLEETRDAERGEGGERAGELLRDLPEPREARVHVRRLRRAVDPAVVREQPHAAHELRSEEGVPQRHRRRAVEVADLKADRSVKQALFGFQRQRKPGIRA